MLWFEIKEVGVFGGFSRFFEEFVGYLAQCGDLFLGDNVINCDIAVSVVGIDLLLVQHGGSRWLKFDSLCNRPYVIYEFARTNAC